MKTFWRIFHIVATIGVLSVAWRVTPVLWEIGFTETAVVWLGCLSLSLSILEDAIRGTPIFKITIDRS